MSYTIYNASAGSGKTFNLVKSFLKIILSSNSPEIVKTLLAITFTNKAVGEMKSRIVKQLSEFSELSSKENTKENFMLKQISEELQISEAIIIKRAEKSLQYILHNYTFFSVSTIDAFNHKLIRSFAFDLELNPNFEVFMDFEELQTKAVANLMQKIGQDKELTDILVEFSKEKISQDKTWDMTKELLSVSNLINAENVSRYIKPLQDKKNEDFKSLRKTLLENIKKNKENVKKACENFLAFCKNNDLDENSFSRGYVYKFFVSAEKKGVENINLDFENPSAWQRNLKENQGKELYSKTFQKKNPEKADFLDQNFAKIADFFIQVEENFHRYNLNKNALSNIIPLSVMGKISQEIESIKEEENILPIGEFNQIIQNSLINQPVPFIYERMGQRYRHYFIDEFQDTSQLQWENIFPLVSDAVRSEISGNEGSLLLVGDAKQSIYRWRGGLPEQFISLSTEDKKVRFGVERELVHLGKNYRSYAEIIKFNNDFFEFIINSSIFEEETYKKLYQDASQELNEKQGGFVQIQMIDLKQENTDNEIDEPTDEEEIDDFEEGKVTKKSQLYLPYILNCVKDAQNSGFSLNEICVLTRSNSQGILVAQYLAKNQISVVSPEALLLKNSLKVKFLILILKTILEPENKELILELIITYCQEKKQENPHQLISKYIKSAPEVSSVKIFFSDKGFSPEIFNTQSLYQAICYAIDCFKLNDESDAFLSEFLNVIYELKNAKKQGISSFLNFWEQKQNKLSISMPSDLNAVNIMTIHKSKGLEFEVVIYAFVDDVLNRPSGNIWIEAPKIAPKITNFEYLMLNKNKKLNYFKFEEVEKIYQEEILDNINILYVALTRPKSHLYVLCGYENKKSKDKEDSENQDDKKDFKNFADIFKAFLKFEEGKDVYEFGKRLQKEKSEEKVEKHIEFLNFPKEDCEFNIVTKQGLLWDTTQEQSIERGNLLHSLLSKIFYKEEVDWVLKEAFESGEISVSQQEILEKDLKKLVIHPLLSDFFTEKFEIFTEKEFITSEGKFIRPDRIAFDAKTSSAYIIDYKTGSYSNAYKEQLQNYAQTLSEIGWQVKKSFLVFLNDEMSVLEV